jgi:hypothetical protein
MMEPAQTSTLTFLFTALPLANTILPTAMIDVMLPWMVRAMVPVIILEVFLVRKGFPNLSSAIRAMTVANLFSTLIAVPLAWMGVLALQSAFYAVAEPLIPREKLIAPSFTASMLWLLVAPAMVPGLYWLVPSASLVLLIPYCYASYRSEFWLVKLIQKRGVIVPDLRRLILRANLWSYAVFGAAVLVWLAWELVNSRGG